MEKNCSNLTSNLDQFWDLYFNCLNDTYYKTYFVENVVMCVIISTGLPMTLVAIYGVLSLARTDHMAPIYIINLLFSDLIQFCCMIVLVVKVNGTTRIIFEHVYDYSLVVSCGLMLCISVERYLVIAWPLWYHFRRSIKMYALVCVVVWALPFSLLFINLLVTPSTISNIIAAIIFLPFPVLIFVVFGTLRALSTATRVPTDEKRRIMALLILVLLTYTIFFLPTAVQLVRYRYTSSTSLTLIRLNPIADLFLYFFLRKGVVDKLLAHVCCCRLEGQSSQSTHSEQPKDSVSYVI